MENSTLDNDYNTTTELQIDQASREFLRETAKWAKFLAIVGFVFAGLMVVAALFIGTIFSSLAPQMEEMPGFQMWIMSFFYILVALFYIVPMYFLYKFATKMQIALKGDDQYELTTSFENLKSLFKFSGIFTLIILGFYALAFVGSIIIGVIAS